MFEETELGGLLTRKTIYQYYLERLNILGYPYDEQGFQLTPYYWVGHAHNIYLQYGTDFGVIMLTLFIGLVVGAIIVLVQKITKQCKEQGVGWLLFLLVPIVFGFLEYSWGVGSITILLLFVAWRECVCVDDFLSPDSKDTL